MIVPLKSTYQVAKEFYFVERTALRREIRGNVSTSLLLSNNKYISATSTKTKQHKQKDSENR